MACRNGSPTKYSPGCDSTTPLRCLGTPRPERNLAHVVSREPHLVAGAYRFECEIRTRDARAHHQHASGLQLRGIAVLERVQLGGPGNAMPSRPSNFAGVNRRNESQRFAPGIAQARSWTLQRPKTFRLPQWINSVHSGLSLAFRKSTYSCFFSNTFPAKLVLSRMPNS